MRYINLTSIVAFLIMLSCCKKTTEETAVVLSPKEVSFLAGDQLTLKPVIYSTDSSLNFIVQTKNSYSCLDSYILYNNASVTNSKVVTSFNGVWLRDACEPVNIPAVSFCQTHAYYKDGIYPVEITFNNKIYKGSLTVSHYQDHYEFNWPYTEGVIIEPKVLKGYY